MDRSRFWNPFARMGYTRDNRFVFVAGEGCELIAEDGRRFLDATAALWYSMVGHGRQELADAMARQARQLEACSCFDIFASAPTLELADRVADLVPVDEPAVFLTSGGSDSVDTAAKVVRRYWAALGRPRKRILVSREHAYHGMHAYGTALAGIPSNTEGLGQLVSDVQIVPAMDAEALAETIDRLGPESVAGFIAEPVIGAGGVHPPPPGYLERVRSICTDRDVLFIADEVVTGFGRTGHWFASERYGVRPDILILAKGLTSGYLPLGATVFSGRIAEPFWREAGPWLRHGYTYSGHATACAVALENLRLLESEALAERARSLEPELARILEPLSEHPGVTGVRVVGLTAGVQLDPSHWDGIDDAGLHLVDACRERGVLTRLLAGQALQVSPPLTVTVSQLQQIAGAIAESVAEVATTGASRSAAR